VTKGIGSFSVARNELPSSMRWSPPSTSSIFFFFFFSDSPFSLSLLQIMITRSLSEKP